MLAAALRAEADAYVGAAPEAGRSVVPGLAARNTKINTPEVDQHPHRPE
jgi:hypothetical protein